MAKGKLTDIFVNQAYATVTESAAGTITFSELQTGISLFEKVAWVVHQINWFFPLATINLLLAEDDYLRVGLVTSNNLTNITLDEPAVLDLLDVRRADHGTAASGELYLQPFVRDFTALPGGGLIVPPKPLYLGIISGSVASVATGSARIYFTHRALAPDEYWELVEARRMVE